MKNNNFDYNEEIKKCKTIDDVMDKNGLIQKLVKKIYLKISLKVKWKNILEEVNIKV